MKVKDLYTYGSDNGREREKERDMISCILYTFKNERVRENKEITSFDTFYYAFFCAFVYSQILPLPASLSFYNLILCLSIANTLII